MWKPVLVGFSWVALSVLAGALVALLLAGRLHPAALEQYANVEVPGVVLPSLAQRAAL